MRMRYERSAAFSRSEAPMYAAEFTGTFQWHNCETVTAVNRVKCQLALKMSAWL